MKSEQFISFFFLAVLLFIVYEVILIFLPFLTAIFWAAILAFAFYPVYVRLKNAFPKHGNLTALFMTLAVFLIVIPPFVMILINIASQAVELSQAVYSFVREGRHEELIERIRSLGWFQSIENRLVQWEPLKNNLASWLLGATKNLGSLAASKMGLLTKNALFILLNLFFMTFLTFVFFKHGEKIYNFIYEIAPFEKETKRDLFRQILDTFAAVIRGQLLTSLAQSVIAGLLFWALGIPLPLLFAFLTFLTSMVPVMGAAFIWLPLAVYLAFGHFYIKALILFLAGFFLISLLDNIIKPAVIGEKTKLPYFLLFFGIMGGMNHYGLMGIFLAPVVLSLFFSLIKIYRARYLS
ncbi:MAG: AI-2E family transporter [Candidatus Omnitrophica bacterium]|nr:AI-2E family transporter [Candidatus Omnitrophota bacterium]